jgi:hypothetical protein
MMKIEKYGTLEEANLKIQGGITGGVLTSQPFVGLVGETITFATPAGSCTFTQPSGVAGVLTFKDVKSQLEAAITNLLVSSVDNKLCFEHALDGSYVSLAAATPVEPARAVLGLGQGEAITGRCLNGPSSTDLPRFVEFVTESLFIYVAVELPNAGA